MVSVMTDLANFGAAGLMGTMWLWERRLSRMREQQLSDAHARIVRDEERLIELTRVVEQNTSALSRFTETQRQVAEVIKDLTKEFRNGRSR
jgi:hypothetical protein